MIETGDILAFKGTGIFSWLIRIYTKSEISHIGIAIWIRHRLCVIEAKEGRGVRLIPLNKCKNIYKVFHLTREINGVKVAEFCLNHWGAEYSNWYQFLILGSRVIRFLRQCLGRGPDYDSGKWFCSELVARALASGGYVSSKHPSLTTPADICKYHCLDEGIKIAVE